MNIVYNIYIILYTIRTVTFHFSFRVHDILISRIRLHHQLRTDIYLSLCIIIRIHIYI